MSSLLLPLCLSCLNIDNVSVLLLSRIYWAVAELGAAALIDISDTFRHLVTDVGMFSYAVINSPYKLVVLVEFCLFPEGQEKWYSNLDNLLFQ